MKPRREARLGPADAAALGPVALAGPGVQLVSDSDASHADGPARLARALAALIPANALHSDKQIKGYR